MRLHRIEAGGAAYELGFPLHALGKPTTGSTVPSHLLQHGGGVQAILYDTDDVQVSVTAGDIKGRVSFLDSVGRNNKIIMT